MDFQNIILIFIKSIRSMSKIEEKIKKAKKLAVLLSVCQDIVDELDGEYFFRNKLKFTQKNFSKELEAFFTELYSNMDEETQVEYHTMVNEIYDQLKLRENQQA